MIYLQATVELGSHLLNALEDASVVARQLRCGIELRTHLDSDRVIRLGPDQDPHTVFVEAWQRWYGAPPLPETYLAYRRT